MNRAARRERWILHADMDAFYASIEQRDDVSLRGRVRLIGVSMSGLVAHGDKQLDLFPESDAGGRLGRALDLITQRFGKQAIFRASPEPTKVSPSLRKKRGE